MKLVRDDNDLLEVIERIDTLRGTKIRFGILGSGLGGHKKKGKGNKLTVVEIAAVHEYGSSSVGIPERSFMRKTFDDKKDEINSTVDEFFGRYVMGEISYDAAVNGVGEFVKGLIQATIRDISSPALKAITIQLKGSSQPLVDSGQLLDSIEYEVV